MAHHSPRTERRGTIWRRVAPAGAALIVSVAVCAPASAASPTIVVRGDSVLATSLPSFGQATIQATRPDALTGAPVVIGSYTGFGNQLGPFSANTTTPTPQNPSGDCWQKGALSQALTPDLQPGDHVTLSQSGLFGGTPSSTSVVVQPSDGNTPLGPITGCSALAPWARNAITGGPTTITGGPLAISGIAQPLAAQVSVSATDGTHSTAPVTATPAADGTWSATIPAAQLDALANKRLTVTPVFAVPDVSTGAQAHIAGVAISVDKPARAGTTTPGQTAGTGNHPSPPTNSGRRGSGRRKQQPARLHVQALRIASRVSLAAASHHGIQASFVVPAGAKVVHVELLHGKTRLLATTLRARTAGSRQTVQLRGNRLHAGYYTIAIRVGTSYSTLGAMTTRRIHLQ
jgi:hypothetical protein